MFIPTDSTNTRSVFSPIILSPSNKSSHCQFFIYLAIKLTAGDALIYFTFLNHKNHEVAQASRVTGKIASLWAIMRADREALNQCDFIMARQCFITMVTDS